MKVNLRHFNAILFSLLMCISGGAVAQTDVARRAADSFISGLISVSGTNDASRIDAFLRKQVDTNYVFNTAFAPVAGVVTAPQRQRMEALLIRFTATQVGTFVGYVQGGEMRIDNVSESEVGIALNGTYRDGRGDRSFTILMSSLPVNGRFLVRDLKVSEAPSIVENLAYTTKSLIQVSPDANVWIEAFERALAETQ